MIDLFLLFALIILVSYVLLIAIFTRGWDKIKATVKNSHPSPPLSISLIIAVRNEERNVVALLEDLTRQHYNKEYYEVIFSDDDSQDNSVQNIRGYIREKDLTNFHVLTSPAGAAVGKKQTLRRGIEVAKGEIILHTDADCRMHSRWMASMAEPFGSSNIQMVIGPVVIDASDRRLFSRLQALEFMSLLGTTGGAANINRPIMCNGANLAYRKKTWVSLEGKISGSRYASGDDMFLLHTVKRHERENIWFMPGPRAIVYTQAAKRFWEFVSQRIRWASKSTGYSDAFTLFTASLVGIVNLLLVLSLLFAMINKVFILPTTIFFLTKMASDFLLLYKVAKFTDQKQLMWLYPLLSLIYPLYVTGIVLMSGLVGTSWKKRRI